MEKQTRKYLVVINCETASIQREYKIIASDVEWSGNGLKFSRDGRVVALFVSWLFWMEVPEKKK